ncbi:hypothetical protein BGX27_005452, partial [Mortierella sp. AM989]
MHADLAACSHFAFFSSVPALSESEACSIWIRGLTQLAESDPKTESLVESLKRKYNSDKKSGAIKQFWDNRKLEQEVEKSEKEAISQSTITVNRTTTR